MAKTPKDTVSQLAHNGSAPRPDIAAEAIDEICQAGPTCRSRSRPSSKLVINRKTAKTLGPESL
jgi:hypothetical protein